MQAGEEAHVYIENLDQLDYVNKILQGWRGGDWFTERYWQILEGQFFHKGIILLVAKAIFINILELVLDVISVFRMYVEIILVVISQENKSILYKRFEHFLFYILTEAVGSFYMSLLPRLVKLFGNQ